MAASAVTIKEDKDIRISCECEFKQYQFDKAEDIWTLVTLNAPCHDDENSRAPIDLVAVIDKSGSMAGHKLKLVKTTLTFMLQQLREEDRLSVVTYDTNVHLNFGLMKMSKENKEVCLDKIQQIRDGSTTNLSGGLLKGLDQIASRTGDKNDVASVLLFTDGLANHGITSSAGIVAAMKNPKMYQSTQHHVDPPKHQSWLQKIIGGKAVEHSEKEQSASAKPKPAGEVAIPASVYTFGFGDDHDPDMLKAISDAGNGMYYFIENEDKIAESFGHCLGGLLSTVGQGIQLSALTQEGATIKQVFVNRPFNIADDKKSVKVDMGDLQSEESRDVVLQLSIDALPAAREETSPQPLLDIEVNYFNVIKAELGSVAAKLDVLRTNVAENKPEEGSVAVNKQRDRIETTNAIRKATEMADHGDFDEAKAYLDNQLAKNVSKAYSNDDDFGYLRDDLMQCTEAVKSKQNWKKKGKKMAVNMAQMHGQQRSSETTSETRYKSKPKAAMAVKFKKAAEEEEEE